MYIKNLKSALACLISLGLLLGAVNSASALGVSQELPRSFAQISEVAAQTGDLITFSQLMTSDIALDGPFDSADVYFSLPANWRLTPGAQLNLSMTSTFSQTTQTGFNGPAGTVTVFLNDILVGVVSIQSAEQTTFQFQLPSEAFAVVETNGLYKLRFVLESGWTCNFDENMLVSIHTNSSMVLPHESLTLDTSLVYFPSPIYQDNAVFMTPLLVVIPDKPSAAELRSAMTVAAGMGNRSSSNLVMDLRTASQLTAEQLQSNNLVLIGKAATVPLLSDLNLPLSVTNGGFSNSGGNVDDGIVQLVNSPWSEDKVVLIVSGNTDAAVIKAAQAVSASDLRPASSPNVAVVESVKTDPVSIEPRLNQTLAEMGYGGREFRNTGFNYISYKFYVPPGQTITSDAYFELHYGHSALLQFDRAGIVVGVNGKSIGSVAFTEETAKQAINQTRFSIPPSAVLTGYNSIEVRINLVPVDRCANPNFRGLYTNIWPESNLHLPLQAVFANPTKNYDLGLYPAPFVYDSTLGSTAFILQRDDLNSWRDVFHVAAYLGDRSNGPVTTLSTFFADELPTDERSKYNFIMVGYPSQLTVMSEINKLLPAPFDLGQNTAAEPEMTVKYRVNPKAAAGYVEMIASPWNSDNIILLAVGNDEKGVNWAASRLIEPLISDLSGNFAVINDLKVYTADTRLTTLTASGTSLTNQAPVLEVVPPVIEIKKPEPYRSPWILPTLIVSIVLILLTIIVVISINWSRNRVRGKTVVSKQKLE